MNRVVLEGRGLYMASKYQLRVLATSRGQMHTQEVAIQWTFDVERNSFFFVFGTGGMDSM